MLIGIDASRANEEKKTGVGWYAWHTIQEFKKITPDNVRVVLYSREKLKGELAILPVNWESKVLKWLPGRLWTQFRLSLEMLFHAPDVLFIPAHVFPIIHPKKTVMTLHDIAAIKFPEAYNWFEKWYSVWSAKYAVEKLWKIIVPSQFTANELASLQASKFTSNNIKIVKHGYNEQYSKDIKNINEILKKYSIIKPYLLSVGRLEEKKNTVRIVKAFNKINQKSCLPVGMAEIINLKLVLIGSKGFGYDEVEKEINKSPYKNDILTPGWVDDNDLPALMKGAEVFVFPSLYEGFGIPILEAFASGTPVVTSIGSATQEVGGDACEYVDPMSVSDIVRGIEKIMTNLDYRESNIEKGRNRIKDFSWEKCAMETWQVLNYD